MFNSREGYSLSDIAAATGSNRTGNDGFGFGGDGGAWWIIILFLFVFCGWGNNGNGGGLFGGGNNSTGSGVTDGYILTSDFASVERKLDTVNSGLCDGFYAMNTGMLNGFSGIQTAINADTVASMQNTNAIQAQLNAMSANDAACCCATQRLVESSFADLNYNMATQSCQTRQAIADTTRDIIESQNNNTRSILDFLTQDKIATLTAENQGLKFATSQQAQNAYLINALNPAPVPAYIVANPCAAPVYTSGCGCATIY